MLCYTHLGLEHMEEESQSLEQQMRKDLLHTMKENIKGVLERTIVSKELKR